MTPLEFLKAVYSDAELPVNVRLRAAIAAANYEHPKLAVTVVAQANANFAERLELAIIRSQKVIEAKAQPARLVSDVRMPPTKLRRI
jgi:hypothetical protein